MDFMEAEGKLSGLGHYTGRLTYTWTLKEVGEFRFIPGCSIVSEYFQPEKTGFANFHLALLTSESKGKRLMSVRLFTEKQSSSHRFTLYLKADCTIRTTTRKVIQCSTNAFQLLPPEADGSFDLGCFMEREILLKELKNDAVVVFVEVMYSISIGKCPQGESGFTGELCPVLSTNDYLLSAFEAGKHSDVVISVKGTDLPAHKFILAARSKVFAAMLDNDMLERNTSRIDISDFEADTVRHMLRFFYSGRVDDLTQATSLELLRAADKYDVEDLKQWCSNYLLLFMNEKNVVEILVAAELHNVKQLRQPAVDCFCEKRHLVDLERCWSTLAERQGLLRDIFKRMCKI